MKDMRWFPLRQLVGMLLAVLSCIVCGCDKPADVEVRPGERWVKTEPPMHETSNPQRPFKVLIPVSWEVPTANHLAVTALSPDRNGKKLSMMILAKSRPGGAEQVFADYESKTTDSNGSAITHREELEHPLGPGLKLTIQGSRESESAISDVFLLYHPKTGFLWIFKTLGTCGLPEDAAVLKRAFESLRLQ